ncbi:MAG: repressor LexA [Bacteroidetes bacterium]|nr:repressor LexA [Bacteroidota bacterium]
MQKQNPLTKIELEAVRIIRNSLVHKGSFPTVRELMNELSYKSPRSAAVVIEQLLEKGILKKKADGSMQFRDIEEDETFRAQTVDVPLLGSVACGMPILAEENIDAMIPVSIKLAKPPHKYFFLRAKGDSMNEKGINDGDMVLVKQQVTANNGDVVVALIDDEATVKEFSRQGDMVILKPRSNNKKHSPIILTRDFQIQGIVITSIQDL